MNHSSRFRKLAKCALLSGASAALPVTAHATTIDSGPLNITISGTPYGADQYLTYDVNNDGVPDLEFDIHGGYEAVDPVKGPDRGPATSVEGLNGAAIAENTSLGLFAQDIAPGADVNSALTYVPSGNYKLLGNNIGTAFPIDGTTPGYFGFEFMVNGQEDYGYVEVTNSITTITNGDGSTISPASLTIERVVYDDSGSQVPVPAPEPASLALFAVGAAGVSVFRRRQRSKTTQAD